MTVPVAYDGAVGEQAQARVTAFVDGRVQGVGFRWWTRSVAKELGLVGHARNMDDGRVEVVAQGPAEQVYELLRLLGEQPSTRSRPGRVTGVVTLPGQPRDGVVGFEER